MNYLDLFHGIGGFALGAHKAGMNFDNHYCSDIELYCQKLYKLRFPESIQLGDITKIDTDLLILDMVSRQYHNAPINIEGEDMAGRLKKLTESQVNESIELYLNGHSLGDLSVEYNVSRQSMWDLLRRRIELRPQKRIGEENNFYRGGIYSDKHVHDVTEKAIKKGILIPEKCEVCGEYTFMKDGRAAVQAHHDDYNKPLSVRWLCQKHHHIWHKENHPIKRKEDNKKLVSVIITGGFP